MFFDNLELDTARPDESKLLSQYDAVLLKAGDHELDIFDLISAIRRQSDGITVIVLSPRGPASQCIKWLDAGADDCLQRPFRSEELEARIKAVIRRRALRSDAIEERYRSWLYREAQAVFNRTLTASLTTREYAVLDALMADPSVIVSKQRIEQAVYGSDEQMNSNVVEILIHSLRKKLGNSTIKNVRGVGWTLTLWPEYPDRSVSVCSKAEITKL
ncbi:Two-component system response regulator QseB [Candidatus Burkholderia verschuerenii]|uniref:Two-component system response regulator QseB n=1 Tax=Candidatus Burkholderia verschuerenii TaxID=242163 RepID=A0A0L0M2R6_9BURK|nr:response regulator transcription factor [Candidatus Burkholderia verschuerenii]KND56957.1 Two-component system response regulator QseB [Candidatus Burkholderia verschuerenii]